MDVNGVIGQRGGCQCQRRNWTAAAQTIGGRWHRRQRWASAGLRWMLLAGARSMDGDGAITMDVGDVIGQRWHKRSMDGGVSGDNGRRRKDTTINQMHGQKADDQKETGRRTMVDSDDG
jgi:hypothetical protein